MGKCYKDYKFEKGICVNKQSFIESFGSSGFWKTNWDYILATISLCVILATFVFFALTDSTSFIERYRGIILLSWLTYPLLTGIGFIRNIINVNLRRNWKRWLYFGLTFLSSIGLLLLFLIGMAFSNSFT